MPHHETGGDAPPEHPGPPGPPPLPPGIPRGGPSAGGLAPDRPAALWAWPLVLLSVFFIGWSVNLFEPRLLAEAESAGEEASASAAEAARSRDASDLAIFKLQSQVVLAAGSVSPTSAEKALEDLRSQATGPRQLVALALVMRFVEQPDSEIMEVVEALPDSAPEPLRRLAVQAVSEGLGEEERAELSRHLGWFARLAPGPGLSESPEASELRARALVTLGLVGGLFFGALAGIFVGGALLVWLLRRKREDPATMAFSPRLAPRGLLLECFAIYLATMALGEVLGRWVDPGFAMASYGLAVVLPLFWPRARGVAWGDFARSMGLHRGKGVWRELRAGAVGYLGVLAIASVGIFLTMMLSLLVGSLGGAEAESVGSAAASGPETHPIVGWIYSGGFWERLLCLLLAAVYAPVFEEIFFRGALHRYFRGRFRFFASALLTGLIFAALHPQGWMGIPALAAIGIGFSLLREWRDSLIAPMLGHAINNGVLVGMLWIAL